MFDKEDNVVNTAEKVNPREENVMISIVTNYITDGEEDTMEILTKGIYRTKGSLKQIIYQDTEATGFENCETKINIRDDNFVTILRRGETNGSDLIMQCDKKFYSQYKTPMGSICLGIMASQIDNDLDKNGGKLHIKYTVDMNGSFVSENEISIKVEYLTYSF
jgi:uncharacterized beta-barrel protein YwiB (DUF1934 family)